MQAKINLAKKIQIILLFCLCAWPLEAGAMSPNFQTGDTWMVEAIYPRLDESKGWTQPTRWKFTVLQQIQIKSSQCWQVGVQSLNPGVSQEASLYYRVEDSQLIRVDLLKQNRGGEYLKVLDFSQLAPVDSHESPVPFDTPVFPLRRLNRKLNELQRILC